MTFEGLLFGLLQVLWCHNFDVSSSSHASSNFGSASCRCHVLIGVLQVLWCHNFSVSSSSHGSTNFGSASCRCHVLIGVLQVLWCHNVGVSSSSHGSSNFGSASRRCHDVVTSASHFDGSKPSHGLASSSNSGCSSGITYQWNVLHDLTQQVYLYSITGPSNQGQGSNSQVFLSI